MKSDVSRRMVLVILLVETGAAAVLRLYDLGHLPPSLFVDEIWSSFSAQFAFGVDPLHWPLNSALAQLFSGQLFQFSMVGDSAFWTRFPAAVASVGVVPLLYALARRWNFHQMAALTASGLFAAVPWSLFFGRYAVPGGAQATMWLVVALLAAEHFLSHPRILGAAISCIALIGFISCSGSAKIFCAIFTPVYFALRVRGTVGSYRTLISAVGLIVIPLGLTGAELVSGARGSGAAAVANLEGQFFFKEPGGLWHQASGVVVRYVENWDIGFLVLHGDPDSKYGPGNLGELGVLAIFGILGTLIVAGRMNDSVSRVLFAWALLWPLPSALVTTNNPNAIRGSVGAPVMCLLCSLGLWWTLDQWNTRPVVRNAMVGTLLVTGALVTSLDYFLVWGHRASLASDYSCGYQSLVSRLEAFPEKPVVVQDRWVVTGVLQFYGLRWPTRVVPPGVSLPSFASYPGGAYLVTSQLWTANPGQIVHPIAKVSCGGRTLRAMIISERTENRLGTPGPVQAP